MRKNSRDLNAKNLNFEQLGATVAHYRELAGITQEQLAERLGYTRRHIGGIETGAPFSIDLLFVLVDTLGIPGDEVFRPGLPLDPLREKRAMAYNLLLRCDAPALNIIIATSIAALENIVPGDIHAAAKATEKELAALAGEAHENG